MRCCSSLALASAEKLRLAASCSAAETMGLPVPPPRLSGGRPRLYRHQAGRSPVGPVGAGRVTEPPAFSTACIADLDAPQTEKETLALISPEPSSRTPSLALLSTPPFTKASAPTAAPGPSLPASI